MGKSSGQIITAFVLYLVMFVIGFISTTDDGEKYWAIALAIIACHIYLSAVIINERELGAMFAFGKATCDLESGLHFAFWPFYYVRRETKNIVQIEIGVLTDEERKKAELLKESISVFLLEDPLRVNWGDLKSASGTEEQKEAEEKMFKGNPYGDAMVTDTHVTVRFRISSLTKLIDKAGSLDDCIELIRGVVVSTLISHAGKSFVGRAIRDMEHLDERLKKAVEEFVVDPDSPAYIAKDSWGIDVEQTQVTRLGTAKRINVAIADKGEAIYKAQGERVKLQEVGAGTAKAIEQKAEADRIRLVKEGIGNSEAERLLLFARQKGIRELAKIAKTPEGQLILQLEALERGLQAGKAVILPMELSRILGALGNKLIP